MLLSSQPRHSKLSDTLAHDPKTGGALFRNLCEETRTANGSIAPEVVRRQAREAQVVHQSLGDAKSRDGVSNTLADSPMGDCSSQCSFESNTKCKRSCAH